MCGNGLLAVRIHTIGDLKGLITAKGANPFDNVAFTVDGDQLLFKEYMTNGWQPAIDVGSMRLNEVVYNLGGRANHTFSTLFPIYEWDSHKGYNNLGTWIETAAKQAGR